jgi:hypothetical protein
MRIPPMEGDSDTVLLLAGDTGSHKRRNIYAAVINRLCDRFRWVYDIPGNHYWYGSDWSVNSPPVERDNYTFGETYVAGDIVAATLWADFQRGNPIIEMQCLEGMNDFKQIAGISIEGVKARHVEQLAFLRASIKPGCIVMTHFAPSWRSIAPEFATDQRNGYYASALDDLIEELQPALWLHGHIHTACTYEIGRTRVICNPAGYYCRDHDPGLMVEV